MVAKKVKERLEFGKGDRMTTKNGNYDIHMCCL